jgi:hypothetical protein
MTWVLFSCLGPQRHSKGSNTHKQDYIWFEGFYTIRKQMNQHSEDTNYVWETLFANHTSDKGLMSKIYKELKKLKSKKINHHIKTYFKKFKQTFLKRREWYNQRYTKQCTISLIIRQTQIKTTMRYHVCLSEWLLPKK